METAHLYAIIGFPAWKRWLSLLVLLVVSHSALPASIGVVENYVLTDTARARQLPVKIYYPQQERAGGYPVIVFSHGSGGSKDGYSYLGRFWAENGYVVIHVTHFEFNRFKIQTGQVLVSGTWVPVPVAAKEELMSANPENWMLKNRALDISFIIDSLPAIADQISELSGRMNRALIGAAGHSEGASTVMAVAGAILQFPAWETRAYGDSRIKAFIAMGPWAPGEGGFSSDSWLSVTSPMLTMGGSQERTNGGTSKDPMLQILAHMPSGGKFHVTVADATHSDFEDHRLDGTPCHDFIERVGLAFWNTALRDNQPNVAGMVRELGKEGIKTEGGALAGVGAKGTMAPK
jgi:predicted dienelactone hydrolase